MSTLDIAHVAVHFILFVAYASAVFYVPSAFKALISLHRMTFVFGAGAFLCGAMTYLGLAVGREDALFFTITDFLQAVSIVGFLIYLAWDLQAALRNLKLAFKAISVEYGAEGDHIIALVTQALRRGH